MDTPLSDSQALPPGTRLEEFVIERVLGSGGFGITYLATDTSLGRQVVIKENLPAQFAWRETTTGTVRPRHSTVSDAQDYEWSLHNFLREAETLASLDHPGIVRVLRKFEANGTAYFVMPFVEGVPFDGLIKDRNAKNKPFSQDELLGLTTRMLDALGYLHDRGIYHRDIKPANMLITNQGVPVLIDFGSARQRLSERSMTVIESPGYTPFEQLQSRGNVGPWSDLYALGGTMVKAITGEAPPKANDRIRKDPYVPLVQRDELVAKYTDVFLSAIDKSLAVDEVDRWQSAAKWRAALEARIAEKSPNREAVVGVEVDAVAKDKATRPVSVETRIRSFEEWRDLKRQEHQAYCFMDDEFLKIKYENDDLLLTKKVGQEGAEKLQMNKGILPARKNSDHSDISDVTWYRRSYVCFLLMMASIFSLGIFPGFIIVTILAFRGDIYYLTKEDSGCLKTWGVGDRVGVSIMAAINLLCLLGIWVPLIFFFTR